MAEAGRPTVFTDEVCRKIEEVAALDGSVEEMAYYAGIHRTSIYNYFKENPEFFDKIQALRERPVLKARQTVVNSLSDPNHAFRYIERKRPKEFAPQSKIEHSGSIETPIATEQLASAAADAIREKYETELRASIVRPQVAEAPQIVVEVGQRPSEQTSGVLPLTL